MHRDQAICKGCGQAWFGLGFGLRLGLLADGDKKKRPSPDFKLLRVPAGTSQRPWLSLRMAINIKWFLTLNGFINSHCFI